MKIYSMTATFGKLEHETLTLQPGLNVISAGNEWGKSTWCAFLAAMLYGVETRAKSTKNTLAAKERYAPWSGSPMSGRMEIHWQGRDITIERKSRGRIPMGEFRAYETASGLDVPELTAHNCGRLLLGVERSVFLRSGYIRLSDLPITDDEALRRRLNSLVTTGDENESGDRLARGLREVKNRVRYNRTGLLPQAEAEREQLVQELEELETLDIQLNETQRQLDETEDWRMALENHRDALRYESYQSDRNKADRQRQELETAREKAENLEALCQTLPPREEARKQLDQAAVLEENRFRLWSRLQNLQNPEEEAPEKSPYFGLASGEEARHQARADSIRYRMLTQQNYRMPVLGVLLLLGAVLLAKETVWAVMCLSAGCLLLVADLILRRVRKRQADALMESYGQTDPQQWVYMAQEYAARQDRGQRGAESVQRQRRELMQQLKELDKKTQALTGGRGLDKFRQEWDTVLNTWDSLDRSQQEHRRAQSALETLESLLRPAQPPAFPDRLTEPEELTQELLTRCYAQRRRLENQLGQYQGRRASLEDKQRLTGKLEQINQRISQLERTYDALTMAQETLAEAAAQLQRRFAPRISRRAGELMGRMTQGRYDRLSLGDDLSIRAGAQQEDTLHTALWRSDGTVDQLYLALRLAVAEALLPQAPLILDDALVRFDDMRLKAAMDILKEEAENRQVILFSCQSREKALM